MTLIEERHQPTPGSVDGRGAPRPPVVPPGEVLTGRWAAVLAGAWVTIFGLGVALEPAPTGEEAFPLLGTAFALALMGSWAVMAVGLIGRHRSGALASAAGAACLVVMTIACPVSGHHAGIGAWWGFQLVGSLTLLGLSRAALARG